MRIEFSNRTDSRGFWIRTKLATLSAHCWRTGVWRKSVGWRIALQFGRGAGYFTILGPLTFNGRTAFIGWRTRGSKPGIGLYTPKLFCVGMTDNANRIPYHFGP